jgi:hypothetical protein
MNRHSPLHTHPKSSNVMNVVKVQQAHKQTGPSQLTLDNLPLSPIPPGNITPAASLSTPQADSSVCTTDCSPLRRNSSPPTRIRRISSEDDGEGIGQGFTPCNSPLNFEGKVAMDMGIRPAMAGMSALLNLTPACNGFHSFALEPPIDIPNRNQDLEQQVDEGKQMATR